MEMSFCRRCGTLLHKDSESYTCENGHVLYDNPRPTAGVFFLDESGNVLLSRRKSDPHKGMLDSIGGFLNPNETIEEALIREINEETGLELSDYSPLTYLCSVFDTYHFSNEDLPIVSSLFYATLNPGVVIVPQDDITEVVSRPINAINMNEIGGTDIKQGLQVLQQHQLASLDESSVT